MFKASCKSSRLLDWYLSVVLTYLCPALYCTFRTSSYFNHSAITLCRICLTSLTFLFNCCNAVVKCFRLFFMLLPPFMLVNNRLSSSLKSGFSAFRPGQYMFSLMAFKIAGRVSVKYSCSSIIWFALSSSVLPLLCLPPGISIFPAFSFICPGSSLWSSSVATAWLINRLKITLFLWVLRS